MVGSRGLEPLTSAMICKWFFEKQIGTGAAGWV